MDKLKNKYLIIGLVLLIIIGFIVFKSRNEKKDSTNKENVIKYNLKLNIDYKENLIFNKYDVTLKLGKNSELLKHGKKVDLDYQLEKGTYTIYFENEDDSSIKNEYKFSIDDDLNIGLILNSYFESLDVKQAYKYKDSDLTEDKVIVDFTSDDLEVKNYKEVVKQLENKGFTNISTEPVYDIVVGITQEESVKKVSIDGSDNFKKWSIVNKDSKVVVYYHMSSEKDPNNKEKEKKAEEKEEVAYYHSSNDIKIAQEGNKGSYAYGRFGKYYDNYIIIDFDNKVFYSFTERNDEDEGLKTSRMSGNLKTNLVVKWVFPDSSGTEKLHFKDNNPEELEYELDGGSLDWVAVDYKKTIGYMKKHTFKKY